LGDAFLFKTIIMFDIADTIKYKEEVKDWTKESEDKLKQELDNLNVQRYPYSRDPIPLKQAIRGRVLDKNGLPSIIGYKMPKTGVWVQKGVSRGHPISNPRTAKDWFNKTIDNNIDKLGDIVMENTGNMIVNALKIS
jgi:hypothetical protein